MAGLDFVADEILGSTFVHVDENDQDVGGSLAVVVQVISTTVCSFFRVASTALATEIGLVAWSSCTVSAG